MGYKVGISSGWWSIGKDPALLGLAQKSGAFGATTGVQFNQVDLDTVIEFLEPELKRQMEETLKTLGIQVGLHGEVDVEQAALESAERRIYEQAHKRTVAVFRFMKEFKFIYLNVHGSQKPQVQQEERQLRPFGYTYPVVDFYGRPFHELAEDGTDGGNAVMDFIKSRFKRGGLIGAIQGDDAWERLFREESEKQDKIYEKKIKEALENLERARGFSELPDVQKEDFRQRVRQQLENEKTSILRSIAQGNDSDFLYKVWRESTFAKYLLDAGEIDAYMAVAIYMYENKEPLWHNIVGNVRPETAYVGRNGDGKENPQMEEKFNSAVAAKYHWGHLHRKNAEMDGMTLKEFCEKNSLYYLIETPHSGRGSEGLARFYRPVYLYELAREVGSPYVKVTIDFEQIMGQNVNLDSDKEGVQTWPSDIGKYIYLIHLGEPKPYWGTAHIPIALGSLGHEALYKWIFTLRKKGFRDGIIIFERGSGRGGGGKTMFEVFEYSVEAIRKIVQFLEQDIEPNKLPPAFYGITLENPDVYARQQVTIREHAWDPLEGVLSVPEEKHTFLSGTAVAKQKGQEWEKRKFR